MILIGITGPIGHGKTTLAEALRAVEPNSVHYESSTVIMQVANALRRARTVPMNAEDTAAVSQWLEPLTHALNAATYRNIAPDTLQIDYAQYTQHSPSYGRLYAYLNGDVARTPGDITTANKDAHRALLQWIGGFVADRVGAGTWHRALVAQAQRSGKELAILGGVRYKGDAEAIQSNAGILIHITRPGMPEPDVTDQTERERVEIIPDTHVINDSTRENLAVCAQRLLADVRIGTLQPVYQVSALKYTQ